MPIKLELGERRETERRNLSSSSSLGPQVRAKLERGVGLLKWTDLEVVLTETDWKIMGFA